MAKKRPQLSLDDLHLLRWLLGSVLALLAAGTVLFMEVQAWSLLLAIVVAAIAGLVRPGWPARVPRWAHRLAFPGIAGALAFDLYMFREPLPALIRLDLMLILYRLVTHRRRRDDLQLIVLALFLIVVAGVLTVSLAFAVQIVAFTACALAFLLVLTLAEAAGPEPVPPAPGERPSWARGRWSELARRVQAAADWRLVALGGGLFAGLVVVSGLLFLAIPRFELSNSLFLDRLINRPARSGFSDQVSFSDVTDIRQDNSLALSIDVDDPRRVPGDPYWRLVVLDDYTGGGFRVSPAVRAQLNPTGPPRPTLAGTARFERNGGVWTFYLEAGISRYLPLLGNFYGLAFQEPQAVGVSDSLHIVALARDPVKMLAYRVYGLETGPEIRDATFALQRRQDRTAATFLDLAALAPEDRQVLRRHVAALGPATDATDFARRASISLAQRHRYALQSTLPTGSGDPLVRWLDSNAPGHCELFAGGLVLLAREAGYPARLITGFRGGSWNAYSNSFTVRNSQAHAWVEIFDETRAAWVRADPTPSVDGLPGVLAAERAAAQPRPAEDGWRARLESVRVFWYRRIVSFDQTTQVEIARTATRAIETTSRRIVAWLDARAQQLKAWAASPWSLPRIGRLAGTLLAVLAVLLLWRQFGRETWLRWRGGRAGRRGDPVRREAGRWLRALQAAGVAGPEQALQRLRFGAPATWPDPPAVFRAARRALKTTRRTR